MIDNQGIPFKQNTFFILMYAQRKTIFFMWGFPIFYIYYVYLSY